MRACVYSCRRCFSSTCCWLSCHRHFISQSSSSTLFFFTLLHSQRVTIRIFHCLFLPLGSSNSNEMNFGKCRYFHSFSFYTIRVVTRWCQRIQMLPCCYRLIDVENWKWRQRFDSFASKAFKWNNLSLTITSKCKTFVPVAQVACLVSCLFPLLSIHRVCERVRLCQMNFWIENYRKTTFLLKHTHFPVTTAV